jgi:hypothetical protein
MECPYCGTTLEEHQAGECFDAWVVEKVLGWERFESPNFQGKYVYQVGHYMYSTSQAWFGQFSPSSDIVDVYLVWEKLSEEAKNALVADDQVYNPLAICKKALEEADE